MSLPVLPPVAAAGVVVVVVAAVTFLNQSMVDVQGTRAREKDICVLTVQHVNHSNL